MPARMLGWHNTDLAELIFRRTGRPAWIENDARAAALGEVRRDANCPQTFIYVKAGSGIGGALVVNGEVFAGAGGMAGDLGHAQVASGSTIVCGCGRRGCLEKEASGSAIREKALAAGIVLNSMQDIIDASLSQMPEIVPMIRRSGELVGRALTPLVNFMNPEAVIVGGALSEIGAFMSSLRASLFATASSSSTTTLSIEPSFYNNNSALIGAARAAHRLLVDAQA